jgi:hypothetical protein
MTKLALAAPIAVLAAALAAGCSTPRTAPPTTANLKPVQQPYLAGTGVVQDVKPAPAPLATPATGTPPAASGMQRLTVRMDNGRMVWVDTPSTEFQRGTRVQLTEANEIRRL